MTDVLRAEWIKLHTVRSHWVLAVVALAFPLVVTLLTAGLADADAADANLVAAVAAGTSLVSAMLWGVIGALAVAGESAHGTLRVTFAAVPQRRRVLLAKVLVIGAVAALAVAAGLAASVLGGATIATSRDLDVAVAGEAEAALAGTVALAVLLAWLGAGIGMVIRTTPAAVAVFVLWPLLAENLVGGLLLLAFGEGATRFLPYNAGTQLAFVGEVDGTWGSRWAAGGYFGLWVLAVLVVGAWLTERRDA
jgi:ABC-2 type transport system permease protein